MRILLAVGLTLLACLLAGLYGAAHNQISYTVSPEYFTRFKFAQFRIPSGTPERLGAAIVGWRAAYRMGTLVALFTVTPALLAPGVRGMTIAALRGMAIATGVTLAVGLLALAVAFVVIDETNVGDVRRFGDRIGDAVPFWRAGAMHNFSYLGGALGSLVGCVATVRSARRLSRSASPEDDENPT